jgi:hypothetical protein
VPNHRRGIGGIVTVTQSTDPSPVAAAMNEAASSIGISTFDSPNGAMMEAKAGAARQRTFAWKVVAGFPCSAPMSDPS